MSVNVRGEDHSIRYAQFEPSQAPFGVHDGAMWYDLQASAFKCRQGGITTACGGGGSPGTPTSSIQFNNSGTFGGTHFNYTPNDACLLVFTGCDTLNWNQATAGGSLGGGINLIASGFQPYGGNTISLGVAGEADGGGGLVVYTSSSSSTPKSIGPQAIAGFFHATVVGNGGAPSVGSALTATVNTATTDLVNGQRLLGLTGRTSLNKTAGGAFVSEATAVIAASSLCDITGCVTSETAQSNYGFKVFDLGGRGTVETAALKILSQTAPVSGTKFAIKADAGSGQSSFGDGIVLPGSTSGSAVLAVAAVAGTPNQLNLPTATGSANALLTTDGANPQQTSWTNSPTLTTLKTASNCSSSAAPAVCGSAASGSVVVAAAATTVVVNTTAVTANSQILLTEDSSLGTKLGVTCNTQSTLVIGSPTVSARSAGTSFTITLPVAPTTNPACFSYAVIN